MFTSVVIGEAPESDNEASGDETSQTKSAVIIGEASESDEESNGSESIARDSQKDAISSSATSECDGHTKTKPHQEDSLFKAQLREYSASLRKNISDQMQKTMTQSEAKLKRTNQLFVQTQVTIQSSINSTRKINQNINLLHKKLDIVFSENYLPDLRRSE